MRSGGKKVKPRKKTLQKRTTYLFLISAFILVCLIAYFVLYPQSEPVFDQTPKVAIVDHLNIQFPNQTFLNTIKAILNETGLEVDYYSSEQVTVDFYRNLPLHNYKLIIFRVHSTAECSVADQPPLVVFFSSEEYSNVRHISEQGDMRVVYVNFPDAHTGGYFGITPLFVKQSMKGRFNNTVVIAMGCEGLKHTNMAEAFKEKGAKAYISWNGSVSAQHTDEATACRLRNLIVENNAIGEAVTKTMKEVGPDPLDNSTLLFYPDTAEVRSYVIPYDAKP